MTPTAAARPRLLYVTRKFPPATGGMELLASQIAAVLGTRTQLTLVALGRSQRHLVWFLPLALARTAVLLARGRVSAVVCGDPVVLLALTPALAAARADVAVVVHGLDLTLPVPPYRAAVSRAVRRAGRVVAISAATGDQAVATGVPRDRVAVVPLGLPVPAWQPDDTAPARRRVDAQLELAPSQRLLVTVGRLVRRKGVRWFVRAVLPRLPDDVVYVVVGAGPEHEAVVAAAVAAGVDGRVKLLGRVAEKLRDDVVTAADAFVMPNVAVRGDMEGFGLVAVEAALRGTPVVAAALEGILDAVVDGETGFLCRPGDADAFHRVLEALLSDREALGRTRRRVRDNAVARYSRERMAADLSAALSLPDSVSSGQP